MAAVDKNKVNAPRTSSTDHLGRMFFPRMLDFIATPVRYVALVLSPPAGTRTTSSTSCRAFSLMVFLMRASRSKCHRGRAGHRPSKSEQFHTRFPMVSSELLLNFTVVKLMEGSDLPFRNVGRSGCSHLFRSESRNSSFFFKSLHHFVVTSNGHHRNWGAFQRSPMELMDGNAGSLANSVATPRFVPPEVSIGGGRYEKRAAYVPQYRLGSAGHVFCHRPEQSPARNCFDVRLRYC